LYTPLFAEYPFIRGTLPEVNDTTIADKFAHCFKQIFTHINSIKAKKGGVRGHFVKFLDSEIKKYKVRKQYAFKKTQSSTKEVE
jgi:hypothetical protein